MVLLIPREYEESRTRGTVLPQLRFGTGESGGGGTSIRVPTEGTWDETELRMSSYSSTIPGLSDLYVLNGG